MGAGNGPSGVEGKTPGGKTQAERTITRNECDIATRVQLSYIPNAAFASRPSSECTRATARDSHIGVHDTKVVAKATGQEWKNV